MSEDFETRFAKQKSELYGRLERLAGISALVMLAATAWIVWPDLIDSFSGGESLLTSLGIPIIILTWALLMQDLITLNSSSRSRLGAASTIGWMPLILIGSWSLTDTILRQIGGFILIMIGLVLYWTSRKLLKGQLEVIRYRGVMGFIGFIFGFSLLIANSPSWNTLVIIDITLICIAAIYCCIDLFGGDENRDIRKDFRKSLKKAEIRILQLRSEGMVVDQAASLIMTASEEGHLDPEFGLRLINEAMDNVERILRFSDDVEDIRVDTVSIIDEAEKIAPLVKRPRSALNQGDREIELGSLREAELLYRQAKKHASAVIEWWEIAEKAIVEAGILLNEIEGNQSVHLHTLLKEAKQMMDAEKPKKAFEYASSIPEQLGSIEDSMEIALKIISEAQIALDGADGLDKKPWIQRMKQAKKAVDEGDSSLGRGLADGILREILQEREAMDEVRRALRQRKKIEMRFSDNSNHDEWNSRLQEVQHTADEKQWSHAAYLLETLIKDLDKQGAALDEASELFSFIQNEWRTLRNQLEASGIKVDDEQRRSMESSVAEAELALKEGRIEQCLKYLGLADSLAEKLRRRV